MDGNILYITLRNRVINFEIFVEKKFDATMRIKIYRSVATKVTQLEKVCSGKSEKQFSNGIYLRLFNIMLFI